LLVWLIDGLVKMIILAGAFYIYLNIVLKLLLANPRSSQFSLFVTNFKLVELFYPGQEYNFL